MIQTGQAMREAHVAIEQSQAVEVETRVERVAVKEARRAVERQLIGTGNECGRRIRRREKSC